ncbi:hypothetical protein [Companilactobacillus sp.]|uniref:hypothetical protein n=1 Tax=Companilactobacillus sp. TaxID=2767905 RepID=UPI00260E9B8C|nr:hypothetical protein [Companilactobacillus sp.]
MTFAERFKLLSLFDLAQVDDEAAGCYHLVRILDTLCSDPHIHWTNPGAVAQIKQLHGVEFDELVVHTFSIGARFNQHHLINIAPLVEAGYRMNYVLRDGVLVGIHWITPLGRLQLEYPNANVK